MTLRETWHRAMAIDAPADPDCCQCPYCTQDMDGLVEMVADYEWRKHEAQVRAEKAEAELARWKICGQCGVEMAEPGACENAMNEQIAGLQSMHEQTLDRAEKAEAALAALRAGQEPEA